MNLRNVTVSLLAVCVVGASAVVAAGPSEAAKEPVRKSIRSCVPIAHRAGPTETADENTAAAIIRDGKLGAWAEVDVRRLKSGGFVLMHDDTFKRTTDGWGVVEDQTLDYVRTLRTEPNGQPVPTLEEALIAAKQSGATLYVELKRYENLYWQTADLEQIAGLVTKHKMLGQVYFGGTRGALNDLRDVTPELRTFWRTKNRDRPTLVQARKRSVEVIQTTPSRVTAAMVKRLQADGYTVAVQSMDKPVGWRSAHKLGIRMVQTNVPLTYRKWCHSR